MAKDISERDFSGAYTRVFWLCKDCPVPISADLHTLYDNIISALGKMDYHGRVDIWAYGDEKFGGQSKKEFSDAGFFYFLVPGGENSTFRDMVGDILSCAATYSHKPTNLVVISKSSKEDMELDRVLRCLASRFYNVLLVDSSKEMPFDSVDTFVDCTSKHPICQSKIRTQQDYDSSRSMETDSDSSRSMETDSGTDSEEKDFFGAYTRVVLDLVNHPIPENVEPYSIYLNIKSALNKLGYHGWLAIWAYGDKKLDDEIEKLFDDAAIMYVQEVSGGNTSLVNKMVRDILGCAATYSDEPTNLVVISKTIKEDMELDRVLCCLASRGYNVLLVNPGKADTEIPFQTVDTSYEFTPYLSTRF